MISVCWGSVVGGLYGLAVPGRKDGVVGLRVWRVLGGIGIGNLVGVGGVYGVEVWG